MDKKKRFGIILIITAVLFAGFTIWSAIKKPETEIETTTDIQEIITTLQTDETTIPAESITEVLTDAETIDIYHDEHSHIEPVTVKYPDDEILAMVNGDKEGLFNQVQAFVNGYGYLDAEYAEYAGDVHYNSRDEIVELTYYLKFNRKDGIYFYLEYNKKTKMWKSFIA